MFKKWSFPFALLLFAIVGGLSTGASPLSMTADLSALASDRERIILPTPTRWRETSLLSFNYTDGAYNLYSGLVFDASGNLYGTTQSGGNYGCNLVESCGVAFELMHAGGGTWTERVLHSFFASDPLGFWPRAGFIMDAKGNLYGTNDGGGPFCGGVGCGAVFELLPNNGKWTARVIYQFIGGSDGSGPSAALTFDAVGNLYGTTSEGGLDDCGTIFELTPQHSGSWTEKILHSFTSDEGSGPEGKLAFDNAGNLYGTTDFGGAHGSACNGYGCGMAFQLKHGANGIWTLALLHSFGRGNDGVYPVSGLTVDSAGNLFGVTSQGGIHSSACFPYGCGTVFKLMREKTDQWKEQIIHDFGRGTDGNLPRGDLIFDASGVLYGTAVFGGLYGGGNAFRLIRGADDKWREQVVHNFGNGRDGINPYSGMILDQTDNLYGTTAFGGNYGGGMCQTSHGCGTIFEITPPPAGS